MNLTKQEIIQEFERQVRLCTGAGRVEMIKIVNKHFDQFGENKLIEAAPEMLNELVKLKEQVSRVSTGYPPVDYELQQWIARVNELIKKATE